MRPLPLLAFVLFTPVFTAAQDPGVQATTAAQNAAMLAQQAAAQANRDAVLASQNAMNAQSGVTPGGCCTSITATPRFSVKAGSYPGPQTVKIKDRSRGSVIYYTTDGWTPTVQSARYRGPFVVDSTMTVQAIAISPSSGRSLVAAAQYEIRGTSAADSAANRARQAATSGASTPVLLAFAQGLSSRTAEVGDKIPMTLTQDLELQSTTIAKGTHAVATVTQVDKNGRAGAPGVISFEVDSLETEPRPIPLVGGATREGRANLPNAAALIPVFGPLTLLRRGGDAVIEKGTPFVAFVDSRTAANREPVAQP